MAYFHFASPPKAQKGVFPKILVNDVRNLPVPKILKGDKLGKLKRDRIAKYAEQMIVLTEKIEESDADRDRNYYQNRRNGLDQKIDGLVFELYGLSDKDIEHVEAFLSNKTA
jgi:hypothetical protein